MGEPFLNTLVVQLFYVGKLLTNKTIYFMCPENGDTILFTQWTLWYVFESE